mgnify:CR=1 FL=1
MEKLNLTKRSHRLLQNIFLIMITSLFIIGVFYGEVVFSFIVATILGITFFLLKRVFNKDNSKEIFFSILYAIASVILLYFLRNNSSFYILALLLILPLGLTKKWSNIVIATSIILIAYFVLSYLNYMELKMTSNIPFLISWVFVTGMLLIYVSRNLNMVKLLDQYQQNFEDINNRNEKVINYAKEIAGGNYDYEHDFSENNALGNSLVEMSKSLKEASEKDKITNWQVKGINQIGDILRSSNESIEDLAYKVIMTLIKYLKANQGGFFIVNNEDEEDPVLELKGAYAFERRKFIEKSLKAGQGLVGQAFLEKDMIYLKEIPENYLLIKSGLGDAPPKSLVIVPMKLEEDVIGVLEIASFREFNEYELDFLKEVSENIASSIISSQMNQRTKKLLEESQQMTEEMRAQEEEMRQNMEELQATQENLRREAEEKERIQLEIEESKKFLEEIIDALPDPVFVKDRDHRIIVVNKAFEESNGIKKESVIGKNDYDLFPENEAKYFWGLEEDLYIKLSSKQFDEKVTRKGELRYSATQKNVIKASDGKVYLVGTNHDITNRVKLSNELHKEKELLDAIMINIDDHIYFKDRDSKFVKVSLTLARHFNFAKPEQLIGKSDFDFFDKELAQIKYQDEQSLMESGKPLINHIESSNTKEGKEQWVSTTKIPLKDKAGKVIGLFGISKDVTHLMDDDQ